MTDHTPATLSRECVEILTQLAVVRTIQEQMQGKVDDLHKAMGKQWDRLDEHRTSLDTLNKRITIIETRSDTLWKIWLPFLTVANGIMSVVIARLLSRYW